MPSSCATSPPTCVCEEHLTKAFPPTLPKNSPCKVWLTAARAFRLLDYQQCAVLPRWCLVPSQNCRLNQTSIAPLTFQRAEICSAAFLLPLSHMATLYQHVRVIQAVIFQPGDVSVHPEYLETSSSPALVLLNPFPFHHTLTQSCCDESIRITTWQINCPVICD